MMFASRLIHQSCPKFKLYCAPQCLRYLPLASRFVSSNQTDTLFDRTGKEIFGVLPEIMDILVSHSRLTEVPEVANWVKQVLDYNIAGTKKVRAVFTVLAYEMLEKPENINEEALKRARIIGLCQEMLLAHFIMTDDIIDGSTTRRGAPCWYLRPGVGLGVINDAVLILCSINETLKHYFGSSPIYADLVNYFNEDLLYVIMGQCLDYWTSQSVSKGYSQFTLENYYQIGKYKMTYNAFNFPVYMGLLLANNKDKKTFDAATDVCHELGKMYQIQNDYLDCYGDERVTGKAGTDIQEGRCSWLAVIALQRCNGAQRALFEECYASKEPTTCCEDQGYLQRVKYSRHL